MANVHDNISVDEDTAETPLVVLQESEIKKRKTKIFVGGLKYSSKDDVLKEYFGKFGEIQEAVVIYDRQTGESKGYGFVTMMNEGDAVAAIANKTPRLDGRKCNVNLAYLGQQKKKTARPLCTTTSNELTLVNAQTTSSLVTNRQFTCIYPPAYCMPSDAFVWFIPPQQQQPFIVNDNVPLVQHSALFSPNLYEGYQMRHAPLVSSSPAIFPFTHSHKESTYHCNYFNEHTANLMFFPYNSTNLNNHNNKEFMAGSEVVSVVPITASVQATNGHLEKEKNFTK